jgi:hypothetical protein
MNLGDDKAFILFVEFFGNFPTPKNISQRIYIKYVCEAKKRQYTSKFLGMFHFQHRIFNFSYLVIYLFNIFI